MKFKRLVSAAVTAALVLSCIPAPALAEAASEAEAIVESMSESEAIDESLAEVTPDTADEEAVGDEAPAEDSTAEEAVAEDPAVSGESDVIAAPIADEAVTQDEPTDTDVVETSESEGTDTEAEATEAEGEESAEAEGEEDTEAKDDEAATKEADKDKAAKDTEKAAKDAEAAEKDKDAESEEDLDEDALEAQGIMARGKCGSVTWTFTSDGTITIGKAGEHGTLANSKGDVRNNFPWHSYTTSCKRIKVLPGVKANKDLGWMFCGMHCLESVDLSGLDISATMWMNAMFCECTSLKSVTGLKTTGVQYLDAMFERCSSLTKLDLSSLNTKSAKNMMRMFYGCSSLKELDISNFSSRSLKYQYGGHTSPTYDMFVGCNSLSYIKVGSNWDTSYEGAMPEATSSWGWYSFRDKDWYGTWYIQGYRYYTADTYTSYSNGGRFSDVTKDAWYYNVVNRAAKLKLMNGYDDGSFGPNDSVTRGQVAVMLWNMAGRPKAGSGAKSFPDVKKGTYYYNAVRWASSKGVVSGYKNGKYGPNNKVTREQLATMMANYAQKVKRKSVTGSRSNYASMTDAGKVSSYARKAVGWCFKSKILTGSNGRINPKGSATRAEAAKMLVRLYDLMKK